MKRPAASRMGRPRGGFGPGAHRPPTPVRVRGRQELRPMEQLFHVPGTVPGYDGQEPSDEERT